MHRVRTGSYATEQPPSRAACRLPFKAAQLAEMTATMSAPIPSMTPLKALNSGGRKPTSSTACLFVVVSGCLELRAAFEGAHLQIQTLGCRVVASHQCGIAATGTVAQLTAGPKTSSVPEGVPSMSSGTISPRSSPCWAPPEAGCRC